MNQCATVWILNDRFHKSNSNGFQYSIPKLYYKEKEKIKLQLIPMPSPNRVTRQNWASCCEYLRRRLRSQSPKFSFSHAILLPSRLHRDCLACMVWWWTSDQRLPSGAATRFSTATSMNTRSAVSLTKGTRSPMRNQSATNEGVEVCESSSSVPTRVLDCIFHVLVVPSCVAKTRGMFPCWIIS